MSLRVLAVSDIHSNNYYLRILTRTVQGLDAVMVIGDITSYGSLQDCKHVLEQLSSIGPVYFVPGECDPLELTYTSWDENLLFNVHGRVYKLKERYKVLGFGGALASTKIRGLQVRESDLEYYLEGRVDETTILLSHNPPSNSCTGGGRGIGAYMLKSIIKRHKPLLVIVGHIHRGRCVDLLGNSKILNPGPLRRGYYSLVNIEGLQVEVQLLRVSPY